MLRVPKSVEVFVDVYAFLSATTGEVGERMRAFDKQYPIDPIIDVDSGFLYDRVERHVDDNGETVVFAEILKEMEGEYLLEMRANIHESMFVVTQLL